MSYLIRRSTPPFSSPQTSRAPFVRLTILVAIGMAAMATEAAAAARSPNILLITTDDQGYGDLSLHGNPKLETPNLDRLAREGTQLTNFHVSPVCAPTRASLLTGRYNYRTGVTDTYLGRALMATDEQTLAELLAAAGYRTGIFGKWHLGDNAPMRPIDQGFQQAIVHRGGGIGQPSDPPGGGNYLDPLLQHNGQTEQFKGYCSDIFAANTLDFIHRDPSKPFFAYLAFNCPHSPLQAPEPELTRYRSLDLSPSQFKSPGRPIPTAFMTPTDDLARIYAMIENIDTNVGKVLADLAASNLANDTIVIFFTDNGAGSVRYNAGLRGWKGSVYEGGIHVPCFIRWPARFPAGRSVDCLAAHIDILPTLLQACSIKPPENLVLDGISLLPLLETNNAPCPERTLYFQWQRADHPDVAGSFAAHSRNFTLLRPEAIPGARQPPSLELYDIANDPFQLHNIAAKNPELVKQMYEGYLAWFDAVAPSRGYENPPRIDVGNPRENPTVLTRQDWRGPRAGWNPNDLGYWDLQVANPGLYEFTINLPPRPFDSVAHLAIQDQTFTVEIPKQGTTCNFTNITLKPGPTRLEAWIEGNRAIAGVLDVTVTKLDKTR
jgi:arylsulfatase A-like enzyme